jgi:hypothetical protein
MVAFLTWLDAAECGAMVNHQIAARKGEAKRV